MAVALLADEGASMVKVESPDGDTCRLIGPAKGDLSAIYIATNRGKRSIALDLKAPAALPVLHALLRRADVVVNNFRPGVMGRLGLDDSALAALNPRLIRLSINGYGDTGPAAGDRVYDAVIPSQRGRNRHALALRALLEPLMARRSSADLQAAFRANGAPLGRVNERGAVLDDPQVRHNQALAEMDHGALGRVRLARVAAKFDGQALPLPGPAAHLGEHGPALLAELGFDAAQVAQLVADGVLHLR